MPETVRQRFARWGLEELLVKYPGLRIAPVSGKVTKVAGSLTFAVEARGRERIEDEYQIDMAVPIGFPEALPTVRETSARIPTSFHKLDDGALCLASPTRLRLIVLGSRSLVGFVDRCVIPYLYGYSYFERHGVLPFGELQHGARGIRQDFSSLFGIEGEDTVSEFLRLASLGKRLANKQACPCGGPKRLGRCHHRRVNSMRRRLGRQWFRGWYASLSREPANRHQDRPL